MEIVILIAAAAAVCAAMLLRGKAWQDFADRHTRRKEDKNKSRRTVRQPVFCPPVLSPSWR